MDGLQAFDSEAARISFGFSEIPGKLPKKNSWKLGAMLCGRTQDWGTCIDKACGRHVGPPRRKHVSHRVQCVHGHRIPLPVPKSRPESSERHARGRSGQACRAGLANRNSLLAQSRIARNRKANGSECRRAWIFCVLTRKDNPITMPGQADTSLKVLGLPRAATDRASPGS